MLSGAGDFAKVQKNVHKCFEAIDRFELDADNTFLLKMVSVEQENVTFRKPIPLRSGMSGKKLEVWLKDVVTSMRATLAVLTRPVLPETYSYSLLQRIEREPAQLILLLNMVN